MDYVTYIGESTIRQISEADWKGAGVKGQKGVRWDLGNGMKVPVEKLSEDAMKVLAADGKFVVPGHMSADPDNSDDVIDVVEE